MTTQRKPDSLYSCLVCFSATTSYMIVLGCQFGFGVLFVALLDTFGESRQKTAWVGSISFSISTLLGPLTSSLNTTLSCRTVSIIGHVIIMIGYLISSYVTSLDFLFFTYGVLIGAGTSFTLVANNVIVAQYFKKFRSLGLAAVGVGSSIGNLSMNPAIRYLLKATDLKTCFLVLCGLHLVPCLLAISFDPNIEPDWSHDIKKVCATKELEKDTKKVTILSVLKNYGVLLFLLSWFCFAVGQLIPILHLVRHCQDLGISQDMGARLYIYFGISGIFGRILAGVIADFLHIPKILIVQWGSYYPMGLATLLLPLIKSYGGLVAYMICFGITEGTCVVSYVCVLYELAGPKQHNYSVGLALFTMSVPFAVSPPFAGFLADQSGSYDIAFYYAGSFFILGGIILHFIHCFKSESSKEVIDANNDYEMFVLEKETVL